MVEKYSLKNIDLFYVDAEGYDGEIILSLLDNSIKCKIIIFEYVHIENNLFMTYHHFLGQKTPSM